MATANLPTPTRVLEEIDSLDNSLVFPHFTAQTAWTLGSLLRTRLMAFSKPTIIDISLAHGTHCLFHAATHSGTNPDNDSWVSRKRNTVLRFGKSTWFMHNKYQGNEAEFAAKFSLGPHAGDFAIHGGGWPLRVRGVEGLVAVVVVSGLKQEEDHGIIVQVVAELLDEMSIELGEKKKED